MKDELIQIKISKEQKEKIREKAKKIGLSISAYMTQLALGNLKIEEVK